MNGDNPMDDIRAREAMSETPEERAKRICVIAKAVGKGLPRNHTERCGHCRLVAVEIRSAVAAQKEKDAEVDPLGVVCPGKEIDGCGTLEGMGCMEGNVLEYPHPARWRAAIRKETP